MVNSWIQFPFFPFTHTNALLFCPFPLILVLLLNALVMDECSFRCAKCHKLVECYSNLLLLRDGSPICEDCSYSCHACRKAIKDEAIMTGTVGIVYNELACLLMNEYYLGEEAYHADCFRCTQCNIKIEDLVFTQTSKVIHGIAEICTLLTLVA